MEQRTCNIIMCCKGHCKLSNAGETAMDAIAAYMSKECLCPKEDYKGALMESILQNALFDYIANADKPDFELRQLFQQYALREPTLSERICTMFQLTRVRNDDGSYANGFSDKLLAQSEKDIGGGAMRAKIIAVDFDGTLIEEGKWPGIGATNEKVLNYCKDEQTKGTRIILWTNRVGEPLETAIKWCEEHGLRLDAVNDNVPEAVEFFGTNTRKIYADEFIDDRMAQGFNLPYYGEPKIKELTDEELIVLYREKYFDERDPIINYWPHETIPHTIVVEHHSGFERTFNVFEYPVGKRDQ